MRSGAMPGGDGRVQQPRAVHVRGEPLRVRRFGHEIELRERPHRAAAVIGGLLDDEESLIRRISPLRAERAPQRLGVELSARAGQPGQRHARKRRRAAALAGDDVRLLVRQHLVARPAMREDRDLVAHRPGRQKHCCFLAEQRGHARAQCIHGRIVADLLVAYLRPQHRFPHSGRRAGLSVREQIDAHRRQGRVRLHRRENHQQSPIMRAGRLRRSSCFCTLPVEVLGRGPKVT